MEMETKFDLFKIKRIFKGLNLIYSYIQQFVLWHNYESPLQLLKDRYLQITDLLIIHLFNTKVE